MSNIIVHEVHFHGHGKEHMLRQLLSQQQLSRPPLSSLCAISPPLPLQFEDAIRKQREHIGNWLKYSTWEESQMEFERSRSVYERSLEVDYRNQVVVCVCVLLLASIALTS